MQRKHPFSVNNIYHIYNRGVAKSLICREDADRWRFLQGLCLFNDHNSVANILWQLDKKRGRLTLNVLKQYLTDEKEKRKPLTRIIAYCPMGNHYHLLLEEIEEGGITKFMHKLGLGYARYFNNKYDRVGSVFQGRFKSIIVDNERYLQYLLVYLNVLNPAELIVPGWKEHGIAEQDIEKVLVFAEKYQWSSHLDYLGKRGSLILDRGVLANILPDSQAYLDLVQMVLREKKYQEIKDLTLE